MSLIGTGSLQIEKSLLSTYLQTAQSSHKEMPKLKDKIEPAAHKTVRIAANLPSSVINDLDAITEKMEITRTEAIRQALRIFLFLIQEIKESNGKLLIQPKDNGPIKEIVLPSIR